LGSGASHFAVGDRVWSNSLGHAGRQGAAAQYAAVPCERLCPLPDRVDPVAAVAILHPAATAYLPLAVHANVRAGETVYVGGGAGNVGGAAILIASSAGARVVATADQRDHDYCLSLGSQTVLDYHDSELSRRLREATPNGVNVYLDSSGHQDLELAIQLLAPRGRVVLMAGLSERPPFPVGSLYTRDGRVLGFAISNAQIHELSEAALRINQLLMDRLLFPRRTELLPLSAAAQAHHRIESNQTGGARLVLSPGL
jgi:NADPH:quinone reductase-like Zn-dependent oxidoreductase